MDAINGWMDGQMDGCMNGWMDRWMNGWMNRQMAGWTNGWMDRLGRWMNMNGWSQSQSVNMLMVNR